MHKNKDYLFGDVINSRMKLNEYGIIAQQYWIEIPVQFPDIEMDEYIIMPNHIHGIICIETDCAGAIHELPLLDLFN